MDATDYWLFAMENSIWNVAVTALQFWMADLNPTTLSNAIERVYTASFCSDSAQHLRYISEEILFSHFVITLNDAFEWELTVEDIGYNSGSESLSIPSPLCQAPQLYHVSTQDNLSFRPATPRACPSPQPGTLTTVCHHLTYEEDEESSLNPRMEDHSPEEDTLAHCFPNIAEDEDDTGEHFPTASLDENVWMEEPIADWHMCIHENSQHDLYPYPCPYSLTPLHLTQNGVPQYMDLGDIFKFPDVITTASNEDIPSLEDILEL